MFTVTVTVIRTPIGTATAAVVAAGNHRRLPCLELIIDKAVAVAAITATINGTINLITLLTLRIQIPGEVAQLLVYIICL
jgi:hypothetical protein